MNLQINGVIWKVSQHESVAGPLDAKKLWGQTSWEHGTLLVDKDLSPSFQQRVLFHELAHAAGTGFSEDLIEQLETTLYPALVQSGLWDVERASEILAQDVTQGIEVSDQK
tara:strand:- start:114 stop:446 length:333 start_codon:yes stop_codon:yes gene_type:complete